MSGLVYFLSLLFNFMEKNTIFSYANSPDTLLSKVTFMDHETYGLKAFPMFKLVHSNIINLCQREMYFKNGKFIFKLLVADCR